MVDQLRGVERRKLGDLLAGANYGITKSATLEPIGSRMLRITDIQDDRVIWEQVPFCECADQEKAKYSLATGDVVIARIGATTGKSFLVRDAVEAVFASYLIRLRAGKLLDPEYLYFFTRSADYWRQINANKGDRLKGGVSLGVLNNLEIPLPALDDQRRIASILRAVQRAKEYTNRTMAAARELKRSLMRHLFTYGPVRVEEAENVPLRETVIGLIPKAWATTTIGDIFNLQQGKSVSGKRKVVGDNHPFLRTANLFWGRLDLTSLDQMDFSNEEKVRYALRPGDLLVCEGGDIGRTGIWNNEIGSCFYQNHLHRLRAKGDDIDPYFYMFWMDEAIRQRGLYLGEGIRTTIPNLSQGRLSSFAIPLPPASEQRSISTALRTVDSKIEAESKRANALSAGFDALLAELISGSRRLDAVEIA